MSGKINAEIEECVRSNVNWTSLPVHLKQVKPQLNGKHFFYWRDGILMFRVIVLFHSQMSRRVTFWRDLEFNLLFM